ncbi:MAG: TIGR03790 family protein [Rhizobacter sp.]|nr:TIGR03790 family protein [Rhizobacter sp.]
MRPLPAFLRFQRWSPRRGFSRSACAVFVVLVELALAQTPAQTAAQTPAAEAPRVLLPIIGLRTRDVAVVVNDADPASVEVARYYSVRRGIAADRVVHVRFAANQGVMSFADFQRVQAVLDAKVGSDVQAYALAWTLPYRVECMSVTAAFAFGFDPGAYCPGGDGCQPTKASPYFNSRSSAPYTDHHMRPAMLLAGDNVESAKRLIDRGLRSDDSWPEGKAYLINTSDRGGRNVRAEGYDRVRTVLGASYPIEQVDADALEGKTDVMFEFTGIAVVPSIASNSFLDGAIADHLTSFGGVLTGFGQTSALEWLSAGATGSYGTATEPCSYRAKFPEPGIVIAHYLSGETLLEAYWKSVLMPGQGVFIGDPLARPFGGVRVQHVGGATVVRTRALPPANYAIEAATSSMGPFKPIGVIRAIGFGVREIRVPAGETRFLRVRTLAEQGSASAQPAQRPAPAQAQP